MPRTTRAAARAQEQQQSTSTDEAQAQLQANDNQDIDTLESDTEDMREPLNPVAGNTKRGRGRPKKVTETEEELNAPQPNAEEQNAEKPGEEEVATKRAPKRARSTRGRTNAAEPELEVQDEEAAHENEFEAWGGGDTEPESVEEEPVAVPTPAPMRARSTRRTKTTEQKPELEQDAEVEPQVETIHKRSRSTRKAKKDSADTEAAAEAKHDHASEDGDNLQELNTEKEAKSSAPEVSKSTRGKEKADSEPETLVQPVSGEEIPQDKIEEIEKLNKTAKTPAKRPRAASKKSTAPKEKDTGLDESVEAQGDKISESEESAEAEAQVQREPEVSKSAETVEPLAETVLPSETEVPPKTPSRARSTRKQAAKVEEEGVPRTTRKTRRQQAEAEQEEQRVLFEEAQVHRPVQETKPVLEDVEQEPEGPAPMEVQDEQIGQPTEDAHPVSGTNEESDETVEVPVQSLIEQQTDQQEEAQVQSEDAVALHAAKRDDQEVRPVEEESAEDGELDVQEHLVVPENVVVESIESVQQPHDEPSPEHDDTSSDSDLDDVERQIFDEMQRRPVRAMQQAPLQPDSFSDTPLGLTQSIDALDAMEEEFAKVEKNLHDVGEAKQIQVSAIVPDSVQKSTTTNPRPISMPPPPKPAAGSRPSSVASKPAARNSIAPSTKPAVGPAAKATLQRSSSVRTAQTKESSGPTKPRQPGQVVDYLAMKRRPVSVSFPTPPPPVKSTKAPTRPTFALPGEAVAAKLKAEKEERLRREAEKAQNEGAKKEMSAKELEEKKKREFKARPLPSFMRSGSGSEGARKDQPAKESEEKKKPPFKARPVPSFIKNPSAAGMVRQTASSKARQSLMQGRTDSEERETSSLQSSTGSTGNPLKRTNSIMERPSNGQRASVAPATGAKRVAAMPVRPKQESESVANRASSSASISSSVSSTTAKALNSATNHAASLSPAPASRGTQKRPLANGTAKSSGPWRATSSASNSTSSGPNPPRASSFTFSRPGPPKASAPARPGPVVKSDVTAADKAAMKSKAKEIFNRDKLDRTRQEQERKEKEEAARKARAEAAERGRQASRAWAEKMIAKKKAPGQGEQAKA